jgi:hypothetical protein
LLNYDDVVMHVLTHEWCPVPIISNQQNLCQRISMVSAGHESRQ